MKPSTSLKILLIFALLSFYSKSTAASSIKIPDKIKVAIATDVKEIELAIKGPYKIIKPETGEILKSGENLWQAKFKPNKNGIYLRTFKDESLKADRIQIIPSNSPGLHTGKCLYRGELVIVKTNKNLLTVINVIDIEDYIKGVLYHEISNTWPIETIKAQAITSRTFALYQAQQRQTEDYHLRADTSSQVYRGVFAEKYRTNKAVDETAGQIMMYRSRVLPAFFHSCCGAHTEKASNLWKISQRFKALAGVKCPFCKNSPYFKWEKSVPLNEIRNKISEAKKKLGNIIQIKIISRNESGRVNALKINDKKSVRLSAKEFRQILEPNVLSSTNFTVGIRNSRAYFKGYGWGHGVGLCQWGAFSMAKKRYDCRQILEYYYPGIKIVKLK